MARQSRFLATVCLAVAAASSLRALGFAAPSRATAPRVQMRGYESGKANIGAEIGEEFGEKLPGAPKPVLECDEGCMVAITECVEEGCSVDALLKLDTKLSEDEAKVVQTVKKLQEQQKLNFSEDNASTLAWLGNFLQRSSSLRAQLKTMNTMPMAKETDLIKQFIKAASVAFGGKTDAPKGDYPKVGASGYSAKARDGGLRWGIGCHSGALPPTLSPPRRLGRGGIIIKFARHPPRPLRENVAARAGAHTGRGPGLRCLSRF